MSGVNGGSGRDALAHMSRVLYERGWMPGTSGNLSLRDGADHAVITGSGFSKGELTGDACVRVDLAGCRSTESHGVRPSAETRIHAAVYRTTRAAAVVHLHPPFATAVSRLAGATHATREVSFAGYELLKGLGPGVDARVPVFPNWDDVRRIADDVEAHLAARRGATSPPAPALLLTSHGMTGWGDSLHAARDRAECVEAICQLLLLTASPAAGSPEPTVRAIPATDGVLR